MYNDFNSLKAGVATDKIKFKTIGCRDRGWERVDIESIVKV